MKKKTIVSERPSIRLDENGQKQLQDLIDLYQKNSITRITVTDVLLLAVDTLHEIKFPDREEHNQ
ncbi:hypothetical protein RYX51_22885 (plasmid) [Priestia filamentosa]|nr:hypothetical protein RYX51_22885 [Priestia filamentosa]